MILLTISSPERQRAVVAAAVARLGKAGVVRRHDPDRGRHGLGVLRAGDFYWFLAISVLTGIGLGSDYGLPPSILADIINAPEGGDTRGKTGTYFGLWALATKLATALGAAGSLPVAAFLGFNPARSHYSSSALIVVYIALPVAIKVIAALLIWYIRIEAERGTVREEMIGPS